MVYTLSFVTETCHVFFLVLYIVYVLIKCYDYILNHMGTKHLTNNESQRVHTLRNFLSITKQCS